MGGNFSFRSNKTDLLRSEVESILSTSRGGHVYHPTETQLIDFKEEAGRRHGAIIEPGKKQNTLAAAKLADEVACMANSPGGGALILGVEDKSGRIIGTELDTDWLRHKIYEAVDVAPDIVEEHVEGQRLLVIYVAPAPEPVEDTSGRLRWRVGDSCRPVDRSQWWEYRRKNQAFDEMAEHTTLKVGDSRAQAIDIARGYRREGHVTDGTTKEFLLSLGALNSEGFLTKAGALLFTANPVTIIELTVFDVFGGSITTRVAGKPYTSTLEQLETVEQALSVINKNNTVVEGLVHKSVPQIPHSAVREALLNALIHRDWNRSVPVDVRWVEHDSTLIVCSPGGFPPAINSHNVLSNRAARYPALADLFRAIGLVDKQGVGVDRMYQSMISLGHRPPSIEEIEGPFVETTLVGGAPVLPILDLVSRIVPEPRQRDYRIAIILYLLFHRAFITNKAVALGLQSSEAAADNALEAACQTTVSGTPVIEEYGGAWHLGQGARALLSAAGTLPYMSTNAETLTRVIVQWLEEVGDISTGDVMELCGVSRGTATKRLEELRDDGMLVKIGSGRSTRYRKA